MLTLVGPDKHVNTMVHVVGSSAQRFRRENTVNESEFSEASECVSYVLTYTWTSPE